MSEPKRLPLNAGEAVRILDMERATRDAYEAFLQMKQRLDTETMAILKKNGIEAIHRWILDVGVDEVCLVEAVPDDADSDARP